MSNDWPEVKLHMRTSVTGRLNYTAEPHAESTKPTNQEKSADRLPNRDKRENKWTKRKLEKGAKVCSFIPCSCLSHSPLLQVQNVLNTRPTRKEIGWRVFSDIVLPRCIVVYHVVIQKPKSLSSIFKTKTVLFNCRYFYRTCVIVGKTWWTFAIALFLIKNIALQKLDIVS